MTLEACLARIEARGSVVRGWAYLDTSAKGGTGPLAGIVLGVKDVIDVAGMPTTHGSPAFAETSPPAMPKAWRAARGGRNRAGQNGNG